MATYRDLLHRHESPPALNGWAVELRLPLLRGLWRRFLLFNDGCFLGRPVSRGDYLNDRGGQLVFVENTLLPTDPANGSVRDRMCARTQRVLNRLLAPRPGRLRPARRPPLFDLDVIGRLGRAART